MKADDPLVSTIIPVYNRAESVRLSIDSALAQTYKNQEIIVVDDGSTDNTPKTLAEYGNAIKVITQENKGVAQARNAGIISAKGKYIAFLDSDDQWLPEKLIRQIGLMQKTGAGVCYTNMKTISDSDNSPKNGDSWILSEEKELIYTEPLQLLLDISIPHAPSSMVVESNILKSTGAFDPRLRRGEDNDLAFRLAMETKFAYVNQALLMFNRNESRNGIMQQKTDALSYQAAWAAAKSRSEAYFRYDGSDKWVAKELRNHLGIYLSHLAVHKCKDRNFYLARKLAWDALHFGGKSIILRSLMVILWPRYFKNKNIKKGL